VTEDHSTLQPKEALRTGTGGRAPQTAGCVTDLRGADNLALH
jgi:hypothetical protein